MTSILSEVQKEREKQNEKWGEQDHHPIEWIAILTEEVGEAAKEAVDWNFKNGLALASQYEINHTQRKRLENYRMELIQIAAVAVQMVDSLDKNELK